MAVADTADRPVFELLAGTTCQHVRDLDHALWITAKTFVMPISHDMFFPPRDCEAEQKLIPNGELRVINGIEGHMALNGFDPEYVAQVDSHLRELLAFKH